jgi:hypothetical protein
MIKQQMIRMIAAGFLSLGLLASGHDARAVTINVTYINDAGVGFNNATLGAQRKTAFEYAMSIWANQLVGEVTINVSATFASLGGTPTSAELGHAGAHSVVWDFIGGIPGTLYTVAEGNQIAGTDLNYTTQEIDATFNEDVDNPTVLGSVGFYYGTDNNPGSNIDFKSVVLHEMGHGLGFITLVNSSTGQWFQPQPPLGPYIPDIYGRQLTQPGVGDFIAMSDGQRLAALTSGNVYWKGAKVVAAKGGQVKMYAPSPYQLGSSISHWDTSNTPDLLMEPNYTGATSSIDLTKQAFQDMQWTFAATASRDWQLYQ